MEKELFDRKKVEKFVNMYADFQEREYGNDINEEEMVQEIMDGKGIEYGMAYTTAEYDEDMGFEANLNVNELRLTFLVNDEKVNTQDFTDIDDLIEYMRFIGFDDLVDDENFPGYSKYED